MGRPVLADTSGYELEDVVGNRFHCSHTIADNTKSIGIRVVNNARGAKARGVQG